MQLLFPTWLNLECEILNMEKASRSSIHIFLPFLIKIFFSSINLLIFSNDYYAVIFQRQNWISHSRAKILTYYTYWRKLQVSIRLPIANSNTVFPCKWKYQYWALVEASSPDIRNTNIRYIRKTNIRNIRNTNIGHWLKPSPPPLFNLIKGLSVQVADLQAARHRYLQIFLS